MIAPVTLLDVEAIRVASRIEEVASGYTDLRPAGHELTGLCCFHDEKTASFYVHPEKQVFHCHGCGIGGDVFTFIMQVHHIGFREAAEFLAARAGLDTNLSPDDRRRLHADIAREQECRRCDEQFELWRLGIHNLVASVYRKLSRRAVVAHSILLVDPESESAWDALGDFYHNEFVLTAALDAIIHNRLSPWIQPATTKTKLRAVFDEAYGQLDDEVLADLDGTYDEMKRREAELKRRLLALIQQICGFEESRSESETQSEAVLCG